MHAETAPRMPPTSRAPLHAAPCARVMGSAAREKFYRGKNRPACPRTVLGLAQRDVGDRGLKGGSLCWCGASCPGKGLAGATEAAPARVLLGEPASSLYSLCSRPWCCFDYLGLRSYLGSPPLPCSVWWCPWLRLPVHSYRGTKSVPLFLYTDRSPRAWATHKRNALLGQAQKRCAGRRGGFYRGRTFRALCFP